MMSPKQQDHLTEPMRLVLERMSADLRPLERIKGGVWSTSREASWQCATGTVRALEKRGLIRELDDARTRYILTGPEGCRPQLERMIRAVTHEIAQERQDGKELDHWLEAERRLLGRVVEDSA